MNLKQAVSSGQPFKRRGWAKYAIHDASRNCVFYRGAQIELRIDDAVADDWEVLQPDTPGVSAGKYWDAYHEVCEENKISTHTHWTLVSRIADKLFGDDI